MKRVLFGLLAVSAATIWLGCGATEQSTPVAEQQVPQETDDAASTADALLVTLSVPNMT